MTGELEQLEKKLLGWAGWHDFDDIGFAYPPDAKESRFYPALTQSLDACFEHLIPKAIKEFGALAVYFAACGAMYEAIEEKEFSTKQAPYDGKPALALCKAILRLIEGDNANTR